MLVIDANVALHASGAARGFSKLRGHSLLAPPLMWSEARSTLHLRAWKGDLSPAHALRILERLERAPVERLDHERLGSEAWAVADELGWGRTYDAEYVALARLLDCRLLTVDRRLRRGADRLGIVIGFEEL